MDNSILATIKKMLGGNMQSDDTAFDSELLVFINTAISILFDIGFKPAEGFFVSGYEENWDSLMFDDEDFGIIKTFIFTTVKLLFDPPLSSAALDSLKRTNEELQWRIYSRSNFGTEEEARVGDHFYIEVIDGKPVLFKKDDNKKYRCTIKNVDGKKTLIYREV